MARRNAASAPRRVLALALALTVTAALGARPTHADTPSAIAQAQLLFDEARGLMKDGKYAEACPKLAESQRLDPAGGTLLNLGICHLREGRSATAYAELEQALAQARKDGRANRERTAEKYLLEAVPLLSSVVLQLPQSADGADLTLELDGQVLDAATLAQAIPVDPGTHQLRASRAGYKPWSGEVTLSAPGEQRRVEIPALEPDAAAPPVAITPALAAPTPPASPPLPARVELARAPLPPALPAHTEPVRRAWVGYAVLGAGAAAVGVGTFFGIRAAVLKSDSNAYFDGKECIKQSCVDDWSKGETAARLSDITLGAGIVALAAGTYLLLSPSKAQPTRTVGLSFGAARSGAAFSAHTEF